MKFLSVLAISIGAVSAQYDVVAGVLNQASAQIGVLNTAVNGFSGDPGPLTTANDQLLTILRDGTTTVANSAPLNQAEALQLPTPVTALNASVAEAVDLIISKQQAFSQACVIQTVLTALQDQKTASSALAAAITSKVPDELGLKEIAAQLSGAIAANLDRGIAVYSSASNAPTCSGSSTGAPPPGSSTPPPGSSTPVPPPGSSTPVPPPGSSTPVPPPGSSTGAPPPPPGSSSGSPPPPPSGTYPTGKPTHPPNPSPSPSKPSTPGTPPSVPDTPPSVPDTPPSVPTRRPTVPAQPSATTTRAPPVVFPGAAPVNQVGASLAFIAGLAALLV